MSNWYIKECDSFELAEEICANKSIGGFIIWPNPNNKSSLFYSTKIYDQSIQHKQILKTEEGMYHIVEENKTYPTLELVILGARNSTRQEINQHRQNNSGNLR